MTQYETKNKLDRLEAVVRKHLKTSGEISIPGLGRELGLSRQAVTYQLRLLAKNRGLVIPVSRRCTQNKALLLRQETR